jgi:hypothetical protein
MKADWREPRHCERSFAGSEATVALPGTSKQPSPELIWLIIANVQLLVHIILSQTLRKFGGETPARLDLHLVIDNYATRTIKPRSSNGLRIATIQGMIDMVVKRQDMRATLARICALLTRTQPIKQAAA